MIAVIAITCHGNTEIFFRMKGHTYLKEFSIAISDISNLVVSVIDAVQNAGFDDSPQLAMEAKSEEEAAFFRVVTDFILQQKQEKVIAEKRF